MYRKGFNLIEVIIATAILLIGVTVTFSIVPNIYKLNQKAWNMSTAAFLAQEVLDDLTEKNSFISNLDPDNIPQNSTQTDKPTELQGCERVWWGETDPFGNTNVQLINVRVSWMEKNIKRSVTVQGLIAP